MAARGDRAGEPQAKKSTTKFMARRYRPTREADRLTQGEDRFARAVAMRIGDAGADDLTPEDLAAAYRVAWPGRAKRFRPETVAGKAAALVNAQRIQAAIAHYRRIILTRRLFHVLPPNAFRSQRRGPRARVVVWFIPIITGRLLEHKSHRRCDALTL